MNDEQIKWLAEKIGWVKYSSDTDKAAVYYTKVSDVEAAEYKERRGGWRWYLSEAGAWDVVTRMGWAMGAGLWDGMWIVAYKEGVGVQDPDPIRAVEKAVIAMWESEQ